MTDRSPPPLLLWQSPEARGSSGEDTRQQADQARAHGCSVHPLPADLDTPDQARKALAGLAETAERTWCVWTGFFTPPAVYREVFEQLDRRGYALINTPEQHLGTLEMDLALPALGELTPASSTVRSLEDLPAAVDAVGGYPVFVKGAIKSRKEMGWDACVAHDLDGLERNARPFLTFDAIARGRIIVRRLAPIVRRQVGDRDFLVSKEFRVFLLGDEVLTWAFYWPYLLEGFWPLEPEEEARLLALAREAARRLPAAYLTVDIAMLESGDWIVVEPGDAQVAGLNLCDAKALWDALVPRLRARPFEPGPS